MFRHVGLLLTLAKVATDDDTPIPAAVTIDRQRDMDTDGDVVAVGIADLSGKAR